MRNRFHRLLLCAVALMLLMAASPAHARIGLIVGEPFGSFGTMMPQGHASIYLSDVCVETAVQLRPCRPGEPGAVISRYHDLRHPELDWLAFPLPVFLYGTVDAVQDPSTVPAFMTAHAEADLRERYRQDHLLEFIPTRLDRHGRPQPPPYGDWEEGIGAAFDRRLLVYSIDTTPAQNATILAWLNDRPNRRKYTLARHNCADFAADLLRIALPPAVIHRNVLADFDMTTPKNLARQVDLYGRAHPELHLTVYEVPQLPGALRRSRPLRGAAETFVATKRYLATLLILQPDLVLADWILYEKRGRWRPGLDASVATPFTWQPDFSGAPANSVTASGTDALFAPIGPSAVEEPQP